MDARMLRKIGWFLFLAMIIIVAIHTKFYGGYQNPDSGSLLIYVVTIILGISGFACHLRAWLKTPSK